MRKCIELSLFSCLLLSGCVLGNKKLALEYQSPYQSGESKGMASKAQANDRDIVFVDFSDKRPNERVGERKNGFYMTMSKVYATNSVPQWVNGAIEDELKNGGFHVKRVSASENKESSPVLEGDIMDVNSISYFSYTGIVTLSVRLLKEGKVLAEQMIEASVKPGVNLAASVKGHGEALNSALQSATEKVLLFIQDHIQ